MLILISGGAASGKSEYAESIAMSLPGKRVYIATMQPIGADKKIARHRKLRAGKGFTTLERSENLSGLCLTQGCVALLECLSNLTANECFGHAGFDGAKARILSGVDRLASAASALIIVTNELLCDGFTYFEETTRYLDILAGLNWEIAARADRVVEVVCGIPIVWKEPGK